MTVTLSEVFQKTTSWSFNTNLMCRSNSTCIRKTCKWQKNKSIYDIICHTDNINVCQNQPLKKVPVSLQNNAPHLLEVEPWPLMTLQPCYVVLLSKPRTLAASMSSSLSVLPDVKGLLLLNLRITSSFNCWKDINETIHD